jgi:ABC-type sugar transport system permease subunit
MANPPMLEVPGVEWHTPAQSRRMKALVPVFWIAPAAILYLVFKLVPLIAGLYLSALRWNGIDPAKFVGIQNYLDFFNDDLIVKALYNNTLYAIGTVVGKIVLALFLAVLLNQGLKGRSFYRTALFMPVVISFVVVSILWAWLYNPQFGLVNELLKGLGLKFLVLDWLGSPKIALWSLMIVDIWKWYGFHMVIFLAGLQAIPIELYEASSIDGASPWKNFLHITLPLLQPVMLVNVTIALMGGFNVFDIPYVMTEGGPGNSTLVMALHIYIRGFKFYKFGYAAAMNYILLVIVTVVSAIQMRLMSSRDTGNS